MHHNLAHMRNAGSVSLAQLSHIRNRRNSSSRQYQSHSHLVHKSSKDHRGNQSVQCDWLDLDSDWYPVGGKHWPCSGRTIV